MEKANRFRGCIIAGSVGDALGSQYENAKQETDVFDPLNDYHPKTRAPRITDDTQLTIAAIESLILDPHASPDNVAKVMVQLYNQKKLVGLGASTFQALRELKMGQHWSQSGRRGEYGAGNGAAMRIAPFAFCPSINPKRIREISSITHHNDEAYIGARCVITAIQGIISKEWNPASNLITYIIPKIPDTRVRDRLEEIEHITDLKEIAKMGVDGYVVNSIPLSIAAANHAIKTDLASTFDLLIEFGGDTDTNCSITGQIVGTYLGASGIQENLLQVYRSLSAYTSIEATIEKFVSIQDTW
ncbi:MAG: ADP-ribosylglycohydrolase family protein [Saprospiraceae bacterium]|nr:ADP-ribosylglycohydrolase family protein [Saprospiraceae bacterium]